MAASHEQARSQQRGARSTLLDQTTKYNTVKIWSCSF